MIAQDSFSHKIMLREMSFGFQIYMIQDIFSPSAFGLKKGEGYYNHIYWLLWQAQFGIIR